MIKKSRNFPERNNATLELNLPHYCTIILVNYEKFFPSIFGYLVLTYLSYFWNFLNIALVSELLMSDHTFHGFQSYTSQVHSYYKHWKKGAHQSHLGRQKMGWFLAD